MRFVEQVWRCRIAGAEIYIVTEAADSPEVLFKKIARINCERLNLSSSLDNMDVEEIRKKLSELLGVEILSSSRRIIDDKAGFP
ncbi:MAG: hypothetical protein WCK16_03685 [Candidatus Moraniibacteriota bacterium]